MDRLTSMEVFVTAVDEGGFAVAARKLNLSRAMVSKHIQALEDRLGARLLNRTTRQLSLTEVGASYYERCARILAEVQQAECIAGESQTIPRGRLRVNAPMSFGVLHLAAAVADYRKDYPEVSVELTLNDRLVDLIEEGYDVAVRIANLADSSLIARALAPCSFVVCASPGYIESHGIPRSPADLKHHNCLAYTYAPRLNEWRFSGPGGEEAVEVHGSLSANNGSALKNAAISGEGVVLQPSFIVHDDLKAGRLTPLLTDYRPAELTIYALYAHNRHVSAKIRSFVDFLVRRFGPKPYWDDWRRSAG